VNKILIAKYWRCFIEMKKLVSVCSFLLGIAIAISVIFVVAASSSDVPADRVEPVFSINGNGETYGSITDLEPEEYPDLVAAIGVNGVEGYFRMNEAHPEDPKTPEEALAWQEELQANGGFYFCPLYDREGNVIGEMQIGPNSPSDGIAVE
jgi:hypothetical protein